MGFFQSRCCCISGRSRSLITAIKTPLTLTCSTSRSLTLPYTTFRASASIRRNDFSTMGKKEKKGGRRLIRISTAEGRWHGNWTTDYTFSLRDLHLNDLVEDGDAPLSISLSIDKHAGFGLSVEGRINTSFTTKCSNCSSLYKREINTNFNVWVLPSTNSDPNQIPEIGSDDPSVIYVKPGCEADLDSLIQDTIRLTTSVNETCSVSCEKSELGLRHASKAKKASSIDKRWSKLLELKNSY